MTGLDGMTQATFANAEARFRAMDLMSQTDGAVDPSQLAKIANQEYNKMFDANGILADDAVTVCIWWDCSASWQPDGTGS